MAKKFELTSTKFFNDIIKVLTTNFRDFKPQFSFQFVHFLNHLQPIMSLKRLIVKINFFILRCFRTRQIIFLLFFWIFVILFLSFYIFLKFNNDPYAINKPFIFIEPIDGYFRYKHRKDKKDWHDYEAIERESNRKGLGE